MIRVIPELRGAHLERFAKWGHPDTVLYREVKWDLTPTDLPPSVRKFTLITFAHALWHEDAPVVEIPEPLWVRELAHTIGISLMTRIVKGRRARVVAYCIENNDLASLIGIRGWLLKPLTTIFSALVGKWFELMLDRVAFGSSEAQAAYSALQGFDRIAQRVILELPEADTPTSDTNNFLFVGRLETRKGVRMLMDAWSTVEGIVDGNITIVGDGDLAATVRSWVSENPTRRCHLGHVDHQSMSDIYLRNRVLVAPSIRDGRWREQVGLPIKEALAHGLTVVTTRETGLASWLSANGHLVVHDELELRRAIVVAGKKPNIPGSVIEKLPALDGRRESDEWLRKA